MQRKESFHWQQVLRVSLAFGWSDFRLKYRGSVLGFLWSFLFPIAKFLVILHIARRFVTDLSYYPLYLFLGIVLWEHFAQTTSTCINYVQQRTHLLQKVAFPREILMLSVGWMQLIILCIYLAIVVLSMPFFGLYPGKELLYLPVILVEATLLSLGIGAFLASYALKYRDIAHIWSISLQILFWLTPVLYVYAPRVTLAKEAWTLLQEGIQPSLFVLFDLFIRFQPLSILLHDARRALIYPDTLGIPSLLHTGAFLLLSGIVCMGGILLFRRRSRYFLQEL